MKEARFGAIDGVRGLAVLIVFFSHTSGALMYLHPALNFQNTGHVGVYLFFCLSAYLLASRFFNEGVTLKSAKRFYIKRFFRIVPLYFLVIIFIFILQKYFGHYSERFLHIKLGYRSLVQHLVFYRGDSVFWSVVAEEQFYILVPLWMFLFIRFRMKAVIAFGILAAVNAVLYSATLFREKWAARMIAYLTTNDRTVGNYIDIFIFSIIILYFFHYNRAFFERHRKSLALIANILFFGLLAATVVLVSMHFLWFREVFPRFRFISVIYTFVFSLFIISVVNGNPVNRLLSMKWLRYTGIFGFSIYLLHAFVLELLSHDSLPCYVNFFLAAAGIFSLSALTYYTIEKPAIVFSHKLIDRLQLNEPGNSNKR